MAGARRNGGVETDRRLRSLSQSAAPMVQGIDLQRVGMSAGIDLAPVQPTIYHPLRGGWNDASRDGGGVGRPRGCNVLGQTFLVWVSYDPDSWSAAKGSKKRVEITKSRAEGTLRRRSMKLMEYPNTR